MCEGSDCNALPAPSTGDAIAILNLGLNKTWALRLSNNYQQLTSLSKTMSPANGASATHISYDVFPEPVQGSIKLHIHENSDFHSLRAADFEYASPPSGLQNRVLYSFSIDPAGNRGGSNMKKYLQLAVGGDGVIGRGMSVEVRGRVRGYGIIGHL